MASMIRTPGMMGRPGKWPWKNGSLTVTFLIPITRFPISSSRCDPPGETGNDEAGSPGFRCCPGTVPGYDSGSLCPLGIQFLHHALREIERGMTVDDQGSGAVIAFLHHERDLLLIGDASDDLLDVLVKFVQDLLLLRLDLLVELLDFALILDHPAAEGLFLLLLGLRAQDGALLDEVFFYLLEVFFLLIDELLADFDVLRQRIFDLLAGLGAIQNLLGLDDADFQLRPPRRHPDRHREREHRAQNHVSPLHVRVPSIFLKKRAD